MIDDEVLDTLFRNARTANGWLSGDVTDAQLKQVFDLMKMAPTSANCQPARLVFLRTAEAKERLKPALSPNNVDNTLKAPIVTLIAHDTQFQEHLARLFPHAPNFRDMFDGEANREAREITAFRNGTLQGAYFIIAARAVGLDCGPMSGFDVAKVNDEFFPDGRFKVNFLCNLGRGDPDKTFPRSPRFDFDEVCKVL
ncbi:MAG: malonic semialdehyde reductase [Burkholderiaceae bacterium]